MSDQAVVTATGIRKSFGRTTVLDGVDLIIERGSVHALLGPNGAGKTTMLRILSTLLRPDGGIATVAGHDVVREAGRVRESIGVTGQYASVDELLTGEENLLLMARLGRLNRTDARRRIDELLTRFDLTEASRRMVKTYSGGMRRRLDLAVSLITRPPIIFLDEPTTGLDPRSRQTMWNVITQLVSGGVTILLTTQYLEEADRLANRITFIDHGRVVAEGTATQLKAQAGAEQVELHFTTVTDLRQAGLELGAQAHHVDEERRSLLVTTDGRADQVRSLLDRMALAAVPVERISLRRPSLDDVYLSLTGGQHEPANSSEAPLLTGGNR
jgi:ABC-2 type transport system ATP-binding protein